MTRTLRILFLMFTCSVALAPVGCATVHHRRSRGHGAHSDSRRSNGPPAHSNAGGNGRGRGNGRGHDNGHGAMGSR